MTHLGIMIEGQEDLTWERLFRLAKAVEDFGFESLFRSDHLTALDPSASQPVVARSGQAPKREALALWPSLTALALRTRRLRFGPLVCSMTFRHPMEVAKMAAAVDVLSGGRLDLGLGAGWYEGEHRMFGIPFPPYRTRLEMLDEGAQVIKALWSGRPVTFKGQHYQLDAAESYPLPVQKPPALIMGGKGEKHTLHIVATQATEWNCSYSNVEVFRRKSGILDEHCAAIGRDPKTIRRSIMIPFVISKDERTIQSRIDAQRLIFPDLPTTIEGWQARGYIGGSPAQVTDQLSEFVEAGAERFMLQQNDLDDLESLELLASDVLPHFK